MFPTAGPRPVVFVLGWTDTPRTDPSETGDALVIPAVMPTYARADIAFVRGEGARLYDETGRSYLDFAAGVAVNALGHCHPRMVAALQKQGETLWHVSNLYRIPGQERLAARLVENSFADTVFFCNSGAEAVEGVIKLARRYHHMAGLPERNRVIVATGAFHGRTLATIAAGDSEKARLGFDPVTDGFDRVPYGDMNALRAAIGPSTAAILVEPVQGEGGARAAQLRYLRELRTAADEFGILLLFDEVQIGFGRSGKLFGHEWADVAPDALAAAKGIAGGFPMGAILATEKAAAGMTAGSHGSTFGGGPLATAVAEAVLDELLSPGFLDRVDAVARKLWFALVDLVARHPTVFVEARGAGLLLGLKCVGDPGAFVAAARDRGLLTVPAGDNVVRLLPPLIITDADVDEAIALLDETATARAAAETAA